MSSAPAGRPAWFVGPPHLPMRLPPTRLTCLPNPPAPPTCPTSPTCLTCPVR